MNFWMFIFLISIAGMIYSAWKSKQLAQHGAYEDQSGTVHHLGPRTDPELKREVEELRERIKVLERIATDGHESRMLSDEIERLREK